MLWLPGGEIWSFLQPVLLLSVRPSDLPTGSYIQEDLSRCSSLCDAGRDCCDLMASCKCGTHTGQYDCICEKGYYGKGLQHECTGRTHGWVPDSALHQPYLNLSCLVTAFLLLSPSSNISANVSFIVSEQGVMVCNNLEGLMSWPTGKMLSVNCFLQKTSLSLT